MIIIKESKVRQENKVLVKSFSKWGSFAWLPRFIVGTDDHWTVQPEISIVIEGNYQKVVKNDTIVTESQDTYFVTWRIKHHAVVKLILPARKENWYPIRDNTKIAVVSSAFKERSRVKR